MTYDRKKITACDVVNRSLQGPMKFIWLQF